MEETDLIVLWGSNARETHPIFFHHVLKAIHAGAKLIVVDPRRTSSAQWADLWLGIDVGSDVALACTVARELIVSGLIDRRFIERATTGYAEFQASVEAFTLQEGERLTGVPADAIRDLAHSYGRADRAVICWTLGITEHHNAVDNVLALINLALLTGHVGKYGSGLNPLRGQNNVQGGGDMGAIPNKFPGFQDVEDDHEARARFEEAYGVKIDPHYGWHLTEMFEGMEHGELRTLYVIGENPAQSEADQTKARKLLSGLDCLIVQDLYLTKTAELADVVFPGSASWVEANGTVTNSERRVQLVRKALDPPGDARDDNWIIRELAHRLGYEWGPPDAEQIWDELRSLSPIHAGMSYERLAANNGLQWPCRSLEDPGAQFLHGRLWKDPIEGPRGAVQHHPAQPARRRARRRVSDPADDRPQAGVLQHRRPVQPLQLPAASRRGARAVSRGRGRAGAGRGRDGAGELAAGFGHRAGADRAFAAPGIGVHELPLPRAGRDQHPHDRRHRPEVRHGRVQGHGDPGGEGRL